MSILKRPCLVGTLLLVAALSGIAAITLPCAAAPSQPSSATAVTDAANLIDSDDWSVIQPKIGSANLSTVRAAGPEGHLARILQVAVNTPAQTIYNIQLTQTITAPVPANHLLRYQFWARSATPHLLRAVIEQDSAPYPGIIGSDIKLTSGWKAYSFTADSAGIAVNVDAARLQVGLQPGTVEFADVEVQDLGLDPTIARDQAALTPAAIQARIRQYRMANLKVRVVDNRGRPISNARVAVQMQRHAFLFGCNIFGLSDIDASNASTGELKLQQEYRSRFAALFNYATLPFYWGAFEPQPDHPDFAHLTWMAQWCEQHGIATKAHPLIWQQVYPAWASNTPDEAIPLLHKRVDDIVDNMSGLTNYYDVINETITAPTYTPANGETAWVARDGAAGVASTVLGWARSAAKAEGAPSDRFIVNDFTTDQNYVNLFQALKARGSLPDAIGIQSHMHAGTWSMNKVWDTCERFSQFGIPIHFTETTVLSNLTPHALDYSGPPATDWPSTPGGEAAQADYVAQFYTVLFSNPDVHAITWWDFSDRGAWLGAPAGLLRGDMSPKPAYERLTTLVKRDWWTDTSGTTGSTGGYTVHAFYGDYLIRVADAHGHTVTKRIAMPEASGAKTVTISMP